LNNAIIDWSLANNLQGAWATTMPLSLEYIAFALLFFATVFLSFGKKGIIGYAIPFFFMIIVGTLYIIDNLYPYGQFTLFQAFVPTAATVASIIFNLMGYSAVLTDQSDLIHGTMPILNVSVCDSVALRRYRKSTNLHCRCFIIFKKNADFMES
jgi:hypothetical protein